MPFLHPLSSLVEADGKLKGLQRLASAGLPTPQILVLSHSAFLEHEKSGFSPELFSELSKAWNELTLGGGVITVRAAFSQKGVPILVQSQTNLPTLSHVISAIENAWEQAKRMGATDGARLDIILQRFFESQKMGHLHTSYAAGFSLVEVLPGQVVYAMTRGETKPDRYLMRKSDACIASKEVNAKKTKMVKTAVGLKEVPTSEDEETAEVLSPRELAELVRFARRMDERFGPQEMEFAFTPDGSLIFFDSRDSRTSPNEKGFCISAGKTAGILKKVGSIAELSTVYKDSIAVLEQPSIDLVTFLALKSSPAGVIVVGGSPSSHSATILREAGIPAIAVESLSLAEGTKVVLDAKAGKITEF